MRKKSITIDAYKALVDSGAERICTREGCNVPQSIKGNFYVRKVTTKKLEDLRRVDLICIACRKKEDKIAREAKELQERLQGGRQAKENPVQHTGHTGINGVFFRLPPVPLSGHLKRERNRKRFGL